MFFTERQPNCPNHRRWNWSYKTAWRKARLFKCSIVFLETDLESITDGFMDASINSSDIKKDLVALLPRLRRFALVLSQNSARADELVAQVCEQALLKAPFQDGKDRLDLRLFGAICSLWRTDIRLRKTVTDTVVPLRNAAVATEQTLKPAPSFALSAELAAAFLLCAVEGLTYREAAAVMATTENSIAETILAARRELGISLQALEERRA